MFPIYVCVPRILQRNLTQGFESATHDKDVHRKRQWTPNLPSSVIQKDTTRDLLCNVSARPQGAQTGDPAAYIDAAIYLEDY